MLAPAASDQWQRLIEHLDLAEGFNLLFLICASTQHAEAAREACASELEKERRKLEAILPLDAREVKDIANLLLAQSRPAGDVLWVSIYPDSFLLSAPDGAEQHATWKAAMTQGLGGLNQARNLFARRQGRPVILAGTDELLQTCPAAAPDLWSIRRGVIILPADGESLVPASNSSPESLPIDLGKNAFQSSTMLSADSRHPIQPPAASLADAQRALTAAQKVRGRAGAEYELLRYLIRAAQAIEGRGHLDEFNQVVNEAANIIQRKDLDRSAPELPPLLNDLARLFEHSAQYSEAESLYRQAMDLAEQAYGSDHPVVATYLSNLALLLSATNRPDEAEPLMRRSLAIDEKAHSPEHPSISLDLNNLGLVLANTSRYEEAESLYRRALAIAEKGYGLEHQNVAVALNNLAQVLHETNRLAEAEPLMRRALAIDEKTHGSEHPIVGIRLNNLATLSQTTNRFEDAEPLLRRVVAIFEKAYGLDHPNVATALNNLAQLLQATNRLAEAEPLMRRALIIDEKNFGAEHPDVARDLNNLARLLQATDRRSEAEPLMRRMVEIFLLFKFRTGHTHPNLRAALENYGLLLKEMGWDDEKIAQHLATTTESVKTRAQGPEAVAGV